MPPAFNLSQDQTLQFNLLLSHSRSHLCNLPLSKYWQGSSSEVLTFFCERLSTSCFLSTNVHTYHLSLFKDRFASTSSQLPIERFVYHPLRNEIMHFSSLPVKPFLQLFYPTQQFFLNPHISFHTSVLLRSEIMIFRPCTVKHFLLPPFQFINATCISSQVSVHRTKGTPGISSPIIWPMFFSLFFRDIPFFRLFGTVTNVSPHAFVTHWHQMENW